MIRIVIADDHAIVRAGLCKIIQSEDDIQVVGETGFGREAIKLCEELAPDVLLLDFELPDLDGLEVTKRIMGMKLHVKILILTMHDSEQYAIRFIQAGAFGFLPKDVTADELPAAVRRVAAGKIHIMTSAKDASPSPSGDTSGLVSALTDRELQVLIRLAKGKTVKEIAGELSIGISTVKTFKSRMMEKLCLRNVSDLTRFALRNELIDRL